MTSKKVARLGPDRAKQDAESSVVERPLRLAGKVALITGAAGNLGSEITRHFLREGAQVIMTSRSEERLLAARDAILSETGVPEKRITTVVLDGADPASVRSGIEDVEQKFGHIDILVNNAGSAGPKQAIENLPLTREELEALQAKGASDTETVGDALRNILGVTWNLVRTAAPILPVGASVINVSTIFSHTRYFGRAAYVVPKAALNALSRELAAELGHKGIRVNLLYPGPIQSERIETVFAAMDGLQDLPEGSTANFFKATMTLERSVNGEPRAKTFPVPSDIAKTCVFLGSDESAAFSGHDFDVTHGMKVKKEMASSFLSRPTMRSLDGTGLSVLIAAGENWEEALELAAIQIGTGAEVLLGLTRRADVAQAEARVKALDSAERLTIIRLNRSDLENMEQALEEFTAARAPITGAIILPVKAPDYFAGPLTEIGDAELDTLMDVELGGAIAVARTLSRYWKKQTELAQEPRFVFMSNPSDLSGNIYTKIIAAGIAELVTIWRDEAHVETRAGRRSHAAWGNEIVRYTNSESENLPFAGGQAARIVAKGHRIHETSLFLPTSIGDTTGARKAMVGFSENITGLHLGKVALITGGSAGIGGQVARLLALAGAKVMMAARRETELAAARDRIVGDLEDIGFSGIERRVQYVREVDVSDFGSLVRCIEHTLKTYGRIDYLINNAGIAGAEEMVIDMKIDDWRHTLNANLVSNYLTMSHLVSHMKERGSGYVLNVSSYFGGEKGLVVAYPNRADYAVSKAGQRAMVESFSRYLGPEVQFNAIAPGPVDGDRLSGVGGKPGLFERRSRLILENRRLNAVYAAVVKALRAGVPVEKLFDRLGRNDSAYLSHDRDTPRDLRDLALECAKEGDGICSWDRYLVTQPIAARLFARLKLAGYLLTSEEYKDAAEDDTEWLKFTPPDDVPFLPADKIATGAQKIRKGVLSQLHLGKMPTEADVAQATVFYLADNAVSGETFMPSGGLNVERSSTERELFGSPKQERIEQMRGTTVWIVGEHLVDYIAETVKQLVQQCHVERVVILTPNEDGAQALADATSEMPEEKVRVMCCGEKIEDGMDQALMEWGRPTTVVSTPVQPLPDRLFDDDEPLGPEEFRDIVEQNLTHHFRIARKASLYDGCQLVLVSPDVPQGTHGPAFALANFIKTTLHAFTATLAVENERVVHDTPVNQINLTRRVLSEEPKSYDEYKEEAKRFARAVLLLGAPLPDAEDSRYRARIYRGTSMTV